MPSPSNRAVVAAAGSGKTEYIATKTLSSPGSRKILLTTYTTRNCVEIMSRVRRVSGVKPGNITVQGWFSFLMNQAARPYQSSVTGQIGYGRSLNFKADRPQYVSRDKWNSYYFDRNHDFRRDCVSELAFRADEKTGGSVIRRLEALYDEIFIDEFQDLSGYDLDFLDLLFASKIRVTVVGDPRQHTYSTTRSPKNKQHLGQSMMNWLEKRATAGYLEIEPRSESWRCNQAICDWADAIYPELPRTISRNQANTEHDGIFHVALQDVPAYAERFNPTILRWNIKTDTLGLPALNIGMSKGSTFDRVLIFPTGPMRQYLRSRDPGKLTAREHLYVAVTRARHSVAFAVDREDARYIL